MLNLQMKSCGIWIKKVETEVAKNRSKMEQVKVPQSSKSDTAVLLNAST